MSALFDFSSLLVVVLLIICSTTFMRSLYPTIFTDKVNPAKHEGLIGICWKASRVGERISEYVAVCCFIMAIHLLLFKE